MTTSIDGIVGALKERNRRSSKVLADAYSCRKGAFAVIDLSGAAHSMEPRQIIEDVEQAFEKVYLPTVAKQLEVDSDHVADIDLFHGTVLTAAAFGAEVEYTPREWPWAKPVLKSITEVDHLRKPDISKSPVIRRFLDQVRWLQDCTGNSIPIKLMDLQSPFTTACQIRHYEDLLVDMMDEPDRVKKLIEIITESSIEFLKLQAEVFTCPSYPGRNYPCTLENMGICIADDSALIPLSPAMYEEFCLPSMLRIAESVKGVFIHSCGNYNHQVDNLLKIPNLRALQMHSGPREIDPLPSWRKIRGRISLWSDTNGIGLGDEYQGRFWDCYEEYVLPRLLEADISGLVLLSPPAESRAERAASVSRLHKQLASHCAKP